MHRTFDPKVLGKRIRQYRLLSGFTQTALAEMLGVSSQAVSSWENSTSLPDIENLYNLSRLLNVTVDELVHSEAAGNIWMIGVDGGGTKTEFALFNSQGEVLKTVSLGGSNSYWVSTEKTIEILMDGIGQCLKLVPEVQGVFIGIAGDRTEPIQSALREKYPQMNLWVGSDSINAFHSAKGDHAMICGTGSILITADADGYKRIGGWGALLGDFGSAFNIGREAVRYAFSYKHGIYDSSYMHDAIARKVKSNNLFLTARDWKAPDIAELSTVVFDGYYAGSKEAADILHKEMKTLATFLDHAFPQGGKLVLCGGVMEHNHAILIPMLEEYCKTKFQYILPELPPIFGACVACCKYMELPCEESFAATYKTHYRKLN